MKCLILETQILQAFFCGFVESIITIGVVIRLLHDASSLVIVVDVSYLIAICLVKLMNRNIIELGKQGLPLLSFVILVCL